MLWYHSLLDQPNPLEGVPIWQGYFHLENQLHIISFLADFIELELLSEEVPFPSSVWAKYFFEVGKLLQERVIMFHANAKCQIRSLG